MAGLTAHSIAGPRLPGAASGSNEGWRRFERALAEVIPLLDQEMLILEVTGTGLYVQLRVDRSEGVHAEAVSNSYLSGPERLDEAKVAALLALGWLAPHRCGSPNFSRELAVHAASAEVARLVVRTFAEVHGLDDPGRLAYRCFGDAGPRVILPALGIPASEDPPAAAGSKPAKRRRRAPGHEPGAGPSSWEGVREAVLRKARAATGDGTLTYDADGDVPLRLGDEVGFARVMSAPFVVRVWTILAREVLMAERTFRAVHQANAGLALVRLVLTQGTLFAAVELPADPFVARHFDEARRALETYLRDGAGKLRREVALAV